MKIRHKITLWVAGIGLLTSLVLSIVVFHEIIEQNHEIHDSELKAAGRNLAEHFPFEDPPGLSRQENRIGPVLDLYWVKVYGPNGSLVYGNDLWGIADVPLEIRRNEEEENDNYTVSVPLPAGSTLAEHSETREMSFRVHLVQVSSRGGPYWVQIARPLVELDEEIRELLVILIIGLLATIGPLVIASYWVAGRIVRPIAVINRLSGEISDKTLSQRIPLGKSRDELYELSSSLNRMFDRLQLSFEKQKQFLANASHDLKTPVAIMRLFFEGAAQRLDLPEAFKNQLVDQSNTLLRMERLVQTLLDLSVLNLKEQQEMQEFDLAALLTETVEEFSVLCAANGIQIETHIPEKLQGLGDKDMVRRLVINIMDNAIKYNREGGVIRLEVSATPDTVQLSLYNTGPGVPKEDLERIFEQFYRVEKSRALPYGGSGLGLTIVKEIVRLHKGRVVMESEPGAWARIRITLPQSSSPEGAFVDG
jgi:two-component system, OmpR family, sensor kinase